MFTILPPCWNLLLWLQALVLLLSSTAVVGAPEVVEVGFVDRYLPARAHARGRYGDGTIEELGDNRWRVRIDIGRNKKGRRVRKSVIVRGSRRDAMRELQQLRTLKGNRILVATQESITVEEFLYEWLNGIQSHVSPRTHHEYKTSMKRYVIPIIGEVKLVDLTYDDVKTVFEGSHLASLKPRTQQLTKTILRSALTNAEQRDLIQRNYAASLRTPRVKKYDFIAFSVEEARTFLSAAVESPYFVFYLLLLMTGLRLSEANALRWKDIDLENEVLFVRRSVSRLEGEYIEGETKTTSSARRVSMGPSLCEALQTMGPFICDPEDHVFPGTSKGYLNIRAVARDFKRILASAGFDPRMRLYDLRHSHVTNLFELGEPVKVISERVGHSSHTTTLHYYTKVLKHMGLDASNLLDEALDGRRPRREKKRGVEIDSGFLRRLIRQWAKKHAK